MPALVSPHTELPAATWSVAPVSRALGALVLGVDLAEPPPDFVQAMPGLLARHGVLVFNDQALAPQALLDFARRYGPLEQGVLSQFNMPGHPEIYRLSNLIENGRPIGSATDGYGWHTDQGYWAKPTAYTLLYALEVPGEGSDTLFSSTRRAYESLEVARREHLRTLRTRQSYMKMIMERAQQPEFAGKVPAPTAEQQARVPEVVHPLVRRHPVDGSAGLYLGGQTLVEVLGMPPAEGKALADELFTLCTQERFQYRHQWRARDLVIWDNRHTMHRATPYDKEKERRLVWRVSVSGERPLPA